VIQKIQIQYVTIIIGRFI